VDPDVQAIGVQLAAVAVRNTALAVTEKIRAVKARKEDRETIVELEAIVNDLVTDKIELVRLANAYEDELVAQRLTADDISYIADNVVPILKQLLARMPQAEQSAAALEAVEALLSVETVTVLQLVGFNFRRAIGEPLTELVAGLISARAASKIPGPPAARQGAAGPRHRP